MNFQISYILTILLIAIKNLVPKHHYSLSDLIISISNVSFPNLIKYEILTILRTSCSVIFLIHKSLSSPFLRQNHKLRFHKRNFLRLVSSCCSWRTVGKIENRYPSRYRLWQETTQIELQWRDLFIRHKLHAIIGRSMESSNFRQGTNRRRM